MITVRNIERSQGTPVYPGHMEITGEEEGLLLLNEVDLEEYLKRVVPSEMPHTYELEALKAQAVCARTYAWRQIRGSSYSEYGAHVDDSTSFQVYNNTSVFDTTDAAVNETFGQMAAYDGEPIDALYYSTSCGHTSDAKDVWYSGGTSDDEEAVSVFLSDDSVRLNLMQEEDFRRFINMEDGASYFEQDLPWFRWQVFISAADIQDNALKVCQTEIGELESVTPLERAESGLLKAIQIKGTLDTCTVYGEYKIRQIFSPENSELMPQTGETVTGWTLLPSAYCYIDGVVENGVCEGYLIHGGGYGHGCGMSQNGAMKMAEMGKSYDEILKYFFPDSELISE